MKTNNLQNLDYGIDNDIIDKAIKENSVNLDTSYIEDFDFNNTNDKYSKWIKYDLKSHYFNGFDCSYLDRDTIAKLGDFFDFFKESYSSTYDEQNDSIIFNNGNTIVILYSIMFTDDFIQSLSIKYKVYNNHFGYLGDRRNDDYKMLERVDTSIKSISTIINSLKKLLKYKVSINVSNTLIHFKSNKFKEFDIKYSLNRSEFGSKFKVIFNDSNIKSRSFINIYKLIDFIYAIICMHNSECFREIDLDGKNDIYLSIIRDLKFKVYKSKITNSFICIQGAKIIILNMSPSIYNHNYNQLNDIINKVYMSLIDNSSEFFKEYLRIKNSCITRDMILEFATGPLEIFKNRKSLL